MADTEDARHLLPRREEYYVATMSALKTRGGSATIAQIEQSVVEALSIASAALDVPHGRQKQYQYDLAWVRTYLKWGEAITNPSPGFWSITAKGSQMSDEEIRSVWRFVVKEQKERRQLITKLPPQGAGPHFTIDGGKLSFARQVDDSGNDVQRLSSLQPLMIEIATSLVEVIEKDAGLWPTVERAAKAYQKLISKGLTEIDFGRLFGQGLLLASAVEQTRRAAHTGNSFALTPDVGSLTEALLGIHAAFLMGSRDGQVLVSDAHAFGASGEQIQELRQSELEISRALAADDAPVAEEVKAHARDLVATEGAARRDHYDSYLAGMARNASIVVVGAAMLATFASVAAPGLGLPAFGSYLAILFGAEALKKSQAGRTVTDGLVKAIDATTVDFVLKNENPLRALARAPHMSWLGKALDWIPQGRDLLNAEAERLEPTFDRHESVAVIEASWDKLEFATKICSIEFGISSINRSAEDIVIDMLRRSLISGTLASRFSILYVRYLALLELGDQLSSITALDFSKDTDIIREELVFTYNRIG